MRLSPADLSAADAAIDEALRTGDTAQLDILGWGELSTTVGFGEAAVKLLPPFDTASRWSDYRAVFAEYADRLEARGVAVVDSELVAVEKPAGLTAFCVQPRLAPASLGPRILAEATDVEARRHFAALFARIASVVDAATGFDAQLANWALVDGEWRYFDLTTPLLRDAGGHDRLDSRLFLAALPAPLRLPVERLALRAILDPYFTRRGVALDLAGNLLKEGLEYLLPAAIDVANDRLQLALGADEVRRHYRADARLWRALLTLRRLDRRLHRIFRRPYPFLLPGPIER